MKTFALLAGLSAALTSAYNLDTFPLDAAIDMPSVRLDRGRRGSKRGGHKTDARRWIVLDGRQ